MSFRAYSNYRRFNCQASRPLFLLWNFVDGLVQSPLCSLSHTWCNLVCGFSMSRSLPSLQCNRWFSLSSMVVEGRYLCTRSLVMVAFCRFHFDTCLSPTSQCNGNAERRYDGTESCGRTARPHRTAVRRRAPPSAVVGRYLLRFHGVRQTP